MSTTKGTVGVSTTKGTVVVSITEGTVEVSTTEGTAEVSTTDGAGEVFTLFKVVVVGKKAKWRLLIWKLLILCWKLRRLLNGCLWIHI